jgi:hypothetical protein
MSCVILALHQRQLPGTGLEFKTIMKIPAMQLAKVTELKVKVIRLKGERESESRRLEKLMKRLQTMIREREQSAARAA